MAVLFDRRPWPAGCPTDSADTEFHMPRGLPFFAFGLAAGIISTLGVVTGLWLPTQAGSVSDGAVDGTSSPGTTLAATEFQDSDPRAHVGRIVERHLHCPKLFRR